MLILQQAEKDNEKTTQKNENHPNGDGTFSLSGTKRDLHIQACFVHLFFYCHG